MVRKLLFMAAVLLGMAGAVRAEPRNVTASLQQALMNAAIRESYKLFVEGRGRRRLLKPVPFSDYKTVDRWLAGAPARFRTYNRLAKNAQAAISRQGFKGETAKRLGQTFLDVYDFSGRLSTDPEPGELHRTWMASEERLRVFPERLFTIRKLSEHPRISMTCLHTLTQWLASPPEDAGKIHAGAARVYQRCSLQ